jgi:uncharacterized protein
METTFGSEPGDTHDAVVQFFANGGTEAWIVRGDVDDLSTLDVVDVVNILCLPDMRNAPSSAPVLAAATEYCRARRAVFIADPPRYLSSAKDALAWIADPAVAAARSDTSAVYFPELVLADGCTVAPSGTVAGIYAQVEPWIAPAGTGFVPNGVAGVAVTIGDDDNTALSEAGIDAIRLFSTIGVRVWGARTTSTDPQWRYVNVRRLALFIETSVDRGLQWVVFEPNDETLWQNITVEVTDFMLSLFSQGAFAGATANQAFYVRCNPDLEASLVNVTIGFAPLMPAEFVIVEIQKLVAASPG